MPKGHSQIGIVQGTGAVINVITGFVPDVVELINADGLCRATWTKTMGDGAAMKSATAGTITMLSNGGVSAYSGDDGYGFSIGVDADLNVSGEALHWVATGGE